MRMNPSSNPCQGIYFLWGLSAPMVGLSELGPFDNAWVHKRMVHSLQKLRFSMICLLFLMSHSLSSRILIFVLYCHVHPVACNVLLYLRKYWLCSIKLSLEYTFWNIAYVKKFRALWMYLYNGTPNKCKQFCSCYSYNTTFNGRKN